MNEQGPNNKASTLNWPTVALILATGAGNWFTTKAGNDLNESEIRRATQEIHDLYPRLDEAINRQKRMQESLDRLKAAQ